MSHTHVHTYVHITYLVQNCLHSYQSRAPAQISTRAAGPSLSLSNGHTDTLARALWPARQVPLATVLLGALVSAMAVAFIYINYCAGNRNLDAGAAGAGAGGHGRMPV
jgi:hypothetical protein